MATTAAASLLLLLLLLLLEALVPTTSTEIDCSSPQIAAHDYCNHSLPIDARVEDLLGHLVRQRVGCHDCLTWI